MRKINCFPLTKHARERHCGRRELGAFPGTNARLGRPPRARRRFRFCTRPRRTFSECITRTLGQLELVVQISVTPWSSVTSLSKRAGEGELRRVGRSMTKQASVVACAQTDSFSFCEKQQSSGTILFMFTLPNEVETSCDASKAQCVTIFTFGVLTHKKTTTFNTFEFFGITHQLCTIIFNT